MTNLIHSPDLGLYSFTTCASGGESLFPPPPFVSAKSNWKKLDWLARWKQSLLEWYHNGGEN